MPVEMGMWRIDGDTPKRLTSAAALPSEATLEQYLEKDPSLLGRATPRYRPAGEARRTAS
jgi:hypothetical protein